jgi:hypothetical protein
MYTASPINHVKHSLPYEVSKETRIAPVKPTPELSSSPHAAVFLVRQEMHAVRKRPLNAKSDAVG